MLDGQSCDEYSCFLELRIVERHSMEQLLSSLNLPWTPDWAAIFGVERPLILDIGFGYGHSLAHLHRTRPDHNIIGLEVDNTCLLKVEKAIARHGWHNVRVVYSFAQTALYHLLLPGTLHEVHINFPDPWFKKRHARRRLMQRDTLDAIVNRMVVGGKFFLATDILDYAEMTHELLAQTPGLTNDLPTPWANAMPERAITKYERRALQEGRTCYYFAYHRNQHPAPDVPVIKELDMPHVVIKTQLTLDEMLTRVNVPDYAGEDGTHVRYLERYRGERSVLFDVYVHEPTIEQRISVVIVERDGTTDEYTIKLGSIGMPRPTAGLHIAVGRLRDAVLQLSDSIQIIQDKVRGG
ncbi:MAG: tRNA (guanosine(46)-N7)-methyltransferase TrmB [Phototrophicales bacterium]|nr:MAG: tRNA (guanosine(46)-N7)-methyltransferase TrmB [Phototrophicales bacterium]RMG75902.1 MAG: tRNA (guanosine(46)-N7)-methyltransferase TrmB [Chloroflexota bacterium]